MNSAASEKTETEKRKSVRPGKAAPAGGWFFSILFKKR